MKKVPDFPISVHVEDNPLRKKDSRFLCNVRFKNDLPEIPSDPKMLLSQLNLDEIGRFQLFQSERDMFGGSSSASGTAPPVRFPVDMGLSTSALYAEQYDVYADDVLARQDAGLLDAGGRELDGRAKDGRKRKGVGNAPWLMRTKYISSESGGMVGGGAKKDSRENLRGPGNSAQEQARRIKRSFEDAAMEKPVHPLNRSLTPVDVKPILPDEALEDWQLVLVNFDSDPIESMKLKDASVTKNRKWAQSLHLKTLKSAEYGRFAVILAPREVNASETYRDDEAIPGKSFMGDYDWMRTYNETVRVDEKGQTYMFRAGGAAVEYSDLSNKLFLRKRKKSKGSGGQGDVDGVDRLRPEKMVLVAEEGDERV